MSCVANLFGFLWHSFDDMRRSMAIAQERYDEEESEIEVCDTEDAKEMSAEDAPRTEEQDETTTEVLQVVQRGSGFEELRNKHNLALASGLNAVNVDDVAMGKLDSEKESVVPSAAQIYGEEIPGQGTTSGRRANTKKEMESSRPWGFIRRSCFGFLSRRWRYEREMEKTMEQDSEQGVKKEEIQPLAYHEAQKSTLPDDCKKSDGGASGTIVPPRLSKELQSHDKEAVKGLIIANGMAEKDRLKESVTMAKLMSDVNDKPAVFLPNHSIPKTNHERGSCKFDEQPGNTNEMIKTPGKSVSLIKKETVSGDVLKGLLTSDKEGARQRIASDIVGEVAPPLISKDKHYSLKTSPLTCPSERGLPPVFDDPKLRQQSQISVPTREDILKKDGVPTALSREYLRNVLDGHISAAVALIEEGLKSETVMEQTKSGPSQQGAHMVYDDISTDEEDKPRWYAWHDPSKDLYEEITKPSETGITALSWHELQDGSSESLQADFAPSGGNMAVTWEAFEGGLVAPEQGDGGKKKKKKKNEEKKSKKNGSQIAEAQRDEVVLSQDGKAKKGKKKDEKVRKKAKKTKKVDVMVAGTASQSSKAALKSSSPLKPKKSAMGSIRDFIDEVRSRPSSSRLQFPKMRNFFTSGGNKIRPLDHPDAVACSDVFHRLPSTSGYGISSATKMSFTYDHEEEDDEMSLEDGLPGPSGGKLIRVLPAIGSNSRPTCFSPKEFLRGSSRRRDTCGPDYDMFLAPSIRDELKYSSSTDELGITPPTTRHGREDWFGSCTQQVGIGDRYRQSLGALFPGEVEGLSFPGTAHTRDHDLELVDYEEENDLDDD